MQRILDPLAEILAAHGQKYPRMQCRDAVKLLYQNEFGGGHLIQDAQSCLNYLHEEYARTPQSPSLPLIEDIGCGMVRVYLGALDAHGLSPEELGSIFIRSATLCGGSMAAFQEKLLLLEKLTAEGEMPFPTKALERYLTEYRAQGCPMVSHSQEYRDAYRPAYRVVLRQYLPPELQKT